MPNVTNALDVQQLAGEWIAAWNAHDLDAVVDHYSDDVEFASPFVARLLHQESGVLRGKPQLRQYFSKGLEAFPELSFELLGVLVGTAGAALHYRSVEDREAVEVLTFDGNDLICRASVYYKVD